MGRSNTESLDSFLSLGDLVQYTKGTKPSTLSAQSSQGALPYLTADYFRTGRAKQFIPEEALSSGVLCEENDLLLIWDGSNSGDVFTGARGVLASTMVKIIPDAGGLDRGFLYFFLKWQFTTLNSRTVGSTIPHVSKGVFEQLRVPMLLLEEQRAIASVLRALHKAQFATERVIAGTLELKRSLMRHLFTYGPVPASSAVDVALKETEIGSVPESWGVGSLGNVARISSGGTPDRSRPEYWGGRIPWIKTGEIKDDWITDAGERITDLGLSCSAARIVPKGTILMAMYGQGVTRGKVARLGINAAINQACAAIEPNDELDFAFLFHWLSYRYEHIRSFGHGANQKNLNAGMIRALRVPLPSLAQQREIAQSLDAVALKLRAERARSQAIKKAFVSLLGELMTGRRRISPSEIT